MCSISPLTPEPRAVKRGSEEGASRTLPATTLIDPALSPRGMEVSITVSEKADVPKVADDPPIVVGKNVAEELKRELMQGNPQMLDSPAQNQSRERWF